MTPLPPDDERALASLNVALMYTPRKHRVSPTEALAHLRKSLEEKAAQIADLRRVVEATRKQRDALESFKCSVEEALNSGDGSYRP